MAHNTSSAPASRSRDARVERTLKALRGALLQLLEKRSFDEITVRDICASSGAGYATFFRHYPDKTALLDDLVAVAISELLERVVPVLYAVDTRAACVTLLSYVDERRRLWSTLLTGGAAGTLRKEFIHQGRLLAAADARASKRRRRASAWLPPDLSVVFGVSGVIEVLGWWLEHRRECTVEQMATILDRLVIAPIIPAELRAVSERAPVSKRKVKRKR